MTFWGRRFRVVKSAGVNFEGDSIKTETIPIKSNESEKVEVNSEKSDLNGESILSPMPGTFYSASSPESDPFVKVGDTISKGDTLCIIEAMKLFNEIESEISGKVVKVLVDDSQPVEFDQPLFIVDPS